jgi:hypothetical protein
MYQGKPELEAQDGVLGEGRVVHKDGRLRGVDVTKGLVRLASLLVVQNRMPVTRGGRAGGW